MLRAEALAWPVCLAPSLAAPSLAPSLAAPHACVPPLPAWICTRIPPEGQGSVVERSCSAHALPRLPSHPHLLKGRGGASKSVGPQSPLLLCCTPAAALMDAHRRGVSVRVISDDDQAASNGSDVQALKDAGIQGEWCPCTWL